MESLQSAILKEMMYRNIKKDDVLWVQNLLRGGEDPQWCTIDELLKVAAPISYDKRAAGFKPFMLVGDGWNLRVVFHGTLGLRYHVWQMRLGNFDRPASKWDLKDFVEDN